MKLSESRQIAAPPGAVWEALIDPEVLKACIPGCQEMTGTPEEGFEAVVTQKVGPVKATFRGAVSLSDVRPGEGCTILGEGKGGAAGFAKGGADIRLVPAEGGTRLEYDAEAKVGGKLAQLGSRVVDGFARKMADAFFARFQEAVEAGQPGAAADAAPSALDAGGGATPMEGVGDPVAPETAGAPAPEKKGFLSRLRR